LNRSGVQQQIQLLQQQVEFSQQILQQYYQTSRQNDQLLPQTHKLILDLISRLQTAIPQSVLYSETNTVILIDVLGDRINLPMDLCYSSEVGLKSSMSRIVLSYASRQQFHQTLLSLFYQKRARGFVRSRAYEIMNSRTSQVIEAEQWSVVVRPGTTIDMNVVWNRRDGQSDTCPSCGSTSRTQFKDGWLKWRVACVHMCVYHKYADFLRSTSCSGIFTKSEKHLPQSANVVTEDGAHNIPKCVS
jgi:hypothetical protein